MRRRNLGPRRSRGRALLAAAAFAGLLAAGPGAEDPGGSAGSSSPPPVVLVLFHGCHPGASTQDWQPLRDAIPPGSTRVVAVDLPGHGEAGGAPIEATGDNTAWMAAWREQGAGAVDRAFARARAEGADAFVVAGGAGCGGFFALMGAERYDVDAVVTLSGLSDQRQRERLTSRRIPVLGIASKDDRDVPARVEAIVEAGAPGSVLRLYPGAAHGTAILAGDPASITEILRWMRERVTRR